MPVANVFHHYLINHSAPQHRHVCLGKFERTVATQTFGEHTGEYTAIVCISLPWSILEIKITNECNAYCVKVYGVLVDV